MGTIYGYCRVSTNQQNIERQVRNIEKEYPTAIIVKDFYSGTKIQRPNFTKLINGIKKGDTIVFDSVSRMSRNATEGIELYNNLMDKGINLIFLKEPHINTDTYKKALADSEAIPMTDTMVDCILQGVNEYMRKLAEYQIELAFRQSQSEVDELRQRTREGMLTAKLNGKQIGAVQGKKLTTKKSVDAKEKIVKYSRDFDGTLSDRDCVKLLGIAHNSYYKYKRELKESMLNS